MFYSLAYKEWLKLKFFFIGALALGVIVIGLVLVDINAIIEFNNANRFWDYIIFKHYLYYGNMMFIPALTGLIFSLAQFVPEVNNKRLKLTLHLPVKENKLFLYMISFGFILILLLYIVFIILLSIVSANYFPKEITFSMYQTLMPWLLAGISVYFFTTFVIVEPNWIRRLLLAITGYFFISQLLLDMGYSSYNHSLIWFTIICLASGLLIFVSGFRFKRGAK